MKNNIKKILIQVFAVSFLLCLLLFSQECIGLASQGLLIWYKNMIPTLFPFMVLSGFLVRTRLSDKISQLLQPAFGWILRLPSVMLYAVFMGFLCGFPMGAKVVADMLENKQISLKQGEYLLAFCNNIGPLYMLGYVIPLFGWENTGAVLAVMYGVPFAYGIILRYFTSYRKFMTKPIGNIGYRDGDYILKTAEYSQNARQSRNITFTHDTQKPQKPVASTYIQSFQISLQNAIEQITLLGGCMIFFNCLQIYPNLLGKYLPGWYGHIFQRFFQAPLCCLLEIGGGLKVLAALIPESLSGLGLTVVKNMDYFLGGILYHPYLALYFLTFGGLSCIMQTCFILKNTGLSISTYIKHKCVQSGLICVVIFFIEILSVP